MGYNAAMFLASNSMNKSSLNASMNNDKLSVSSIPNNNSNNQIGSPYNTTPIPLISSNPSSQQSLDSLNIPKNSEVLYSPDINVMIEASSYKQSLQLSNLPRKKVASYPSALNSTEMEQVESVLRSPQLINSPLVNSPTSSLNEFDPSIKTVSSPQADVSLTNNNTIPNIDGDHKMSNTLLLKDYNSYRSQNSSNTKKTPSIVLTPSTDSLVTPSQMAVDNRNILHTNNSLSLRRNSISSLAPSFMNDNSSLHIGSRNDSHRVNNINLTSNENSNGGFLNNNNTSLTLTNITSSPESTINNNNSLQIEKSKQDNDGNDLPVPSKSSKPKKTRKRKMQDKQTSSKKKNSGKKGQTNDENNEEVSTQDSNDTNSKQSSNGRVIKYPRIYECKFPGCNKAFTKAHNLRSHERSHMNDRPYSCKYCEKSFVRQYDLLRHERIHTGVKPYVCKKCLAAFSRNDAYNKHIRSCFDKKD